MKLRLAAVWLVIIGLAVLQARSFDVGFDKHVPWRNLKLLVHKKRPKPINVYQEKMLDDELGEWKLDRPLRVALPPMYSEPVFGNAGFLSGFINHGEVLLYNEPYPLPKLSIDEHTEGTSASYHFDNLSTNASLYTTVEGTPWPLGYTTWRDVLFARNYVDVSTPRLVDEAGFVIEPTAVRAIHPLNSVFMEGDTTRMEMHHLSPIVWTFPKEGHLQKPQPGFVIESVADGAEVSFMPALPGHRPFGMFLLARGVEPTTSAAPHWWPLDVRFRNAVLDHRPFEERRALVRELAHEYPTHPFLAHYRVIAELGGDRFDRTWLDEQRFDCQLSTWYLVAWTQLPWRTVRELPCLAKLPPTAKNTKAEYIAESVVLAYRDLRDDPELKALAARVVDRSYLRSEFRGFNYPLSNFAWLWLKARP